MTDRRTDTQTEGRETARGGARRRRRRRGRLWFDARRGAAQMIHSVNQWKPVQSPARWESTRRI